MTKPKKRRDPESHVPSGRPNTRTLAQFRREVVALLKAGHRIPSETAVRLVAKYHTFVADSWQIRRAPCWVSDNIARKHKEASRDPGATPKERGWLGRMKQSNSLIDRKRAWLIEREPRRAKAYLIHAPAESINRLYAELHKGPARDPEDPEPGEVYQSKTTGNIWEVTAFNRDRRRVKVKRTGMKDLGELTWNPVVLRQMKQLQTRVAAEIRHDEGPPAPTRGWFERNFSKPSEMPVAPDMDGPARRYYVYVIETMRGGERILYVGQSAHKPAQRLMQHKKGAAYCTGCTKRSYAKGAKMRLVPEFYRGIPVIRSRQRAEKVERILARKLRSLGFHVEGGH